MSNTEFYPLIAPKKDGLLALESDSWILTPIKTLGNYLEVYSYLLSPTYNQLIYLEFNSGSGMVELRNTGDNVYDTSLLALASPIQFTRYIFWEPDETYAQALRVRVNRSFKEKNVLIVSSPLKHFLAQLENYIPVNSKGIKPWIFCNLNPRFGFPDPEFLNALKGIDPVIFFTLSGQRQGFWSKLKPGKDGFETEARSHLRNMEEWSQNNDFKIKGSFSMNESEIMDPLFYQGVICRKASVKKVVTEVQRKTSGQFQLFG